MEVGKFIFAISLFVLQKYQKQTEMTIDELAAHVLARAVLCKY